MTIKELHDFINTKLNALTGDLPFSSGFLFAYDDDKLTVKTADATTLQIDEVDYIPYSIAAYESESQPLKELDIFLYTIPLSFALKYEEKDAWSAKINEFIGVMNGYSFTVGDNIVAFGSTGQTNIGNNPELNAGDWIEMTLTLFGYASKTHVGNDVVFTLNSVVIQPLKYTSNMQNQGEITMPQDKTRSEYDSNGKVHSRQLVLHYAIALADTWAKEIELDVLNTEYPLTIKYPTFTLSTTVKVKDASSVIVNGTSIIFQLDFIDA